MIGGLTDDLLPVDRESEGSLLRLAETVHEKLPIILSVFTAVFVKDTNHVLLVQLGDYAIGDIGGNPWTLPGGSVNVNEDAKSASCREIAEEATVQVDSERLTLAAWIARPYVRRRDCHGEVTLVFTVCIERQEPYPNPPETVDSDWFPFEVDNWLSVPPVGTGDRMQPLRRHWVYWTKIAAEANLCGRPRVLIYHNSTAMSESPVLCD